MNSTVLNLQQYKQQLQNVLDNIQKLEHLQANGVENLHLEQVNTLMKQTSHLLSNLEKGPTQRIKKILEKRKLKRQKAKKLRRKLSHQNESSTILTDVKSTEVLTTKTVADKPTTSNGLAQKPHQQLRSFNDANRFLRTFELLEKLHFARSLDEKATNDFANKLSKLRTIWNIIRLENKPDLSSTQNIENQWNTVLFGTTEKTFYKQKQSITDLISIRRKWDSYLTNDASFGSTIPANWVLPPEKVDERWLRYRVE